MQAKIINNFNSKISSTVHRIFKIIEEFYVINGPHYLIEVEDKIPKTL